MAKFNFQGKLFEQGRRVITGVVNTINIVKLDSSDNPSGTLEIATDQTGRSSLRMNLSLPQGEPGNKGDTPNISVGTVTTGAAGGRVSITKTETEDGCALNFTIPQGSDGKDGVNGKDGIDGKNGYTPKVEVVQQIEVLEAGANAWVEDINDDLYDAKWKFHLPKGDQGDKGDKGDSFEIKHVFASIVDMEAADAQNQIHPGEYAVIQADVEREENSRLYYKQFNGELTYLNDFSGARGAHAVAFAGTATKLKSTAIPTVGLKTGDPSYNSNLDQYESTFNFGIPAGASAKISSISATQLNSNQQPTASVTNTYDSTEDINNAAIELGIPQGASAQITSVNVNTLAPGTDATASVTTVYNTSTDTNDSTLSFGIPRGSKPNMGIGTVADVPYGDSPTVEIVEDRTGNQDYLFNFGLPQGTKGDKGEPGDIAGITDTGGYVGITNIESDATDPHILVVTHGGIPATDITSGILGVNRGGTGKNEHVVNSILTGNGTGALNNISTTNGAFYATSAGGAAQFGTLPIAQGGTGLTTNPSMTVDLSSSNAANVFVAAPQPGVSGTLGLTNGGTGATTAADARTNLEVYSKTEIDSLETSIDQKITEEVDKIIVIDSEEPASEHTKIWIKI